MTNELICPHCNERYNEFKLCDNCKTQVLPIADFNKILNYLNKGNESFYDSDMQSALEFYDLANEELPNCEVLFYYKGLCYFYSDEYAKLTEVCNKALKLNPSHLGANALKGEYYLLTEQFDKCSEIIDKIIKYDQDGFIHKMKIELLFNTANFEESKKVLNEALIKFPFNDTINSLNSLLNNLEKTNKVFLKSIMDKFGHYLQSEIDKLNKAGSPDKMIVILDDKFKRIINELSEDDLLDISEFFYCFEEYDESLFYLNQVNESIRYNTLRANLYFANDQYDECNNLLKKIFKEDPNFEDGLILNAKLINHKKGTKKAIKYCKKVFNLDSEKSLLFLNDLYFFNDYYEESLECIEKLLKLGYDNKILYYQKVENLQQLGRFDESFKVMDLIEDSQADELLTEIMDIGDCQNIIWDYSPNNYLNPYFFDFEDNYSEPTSVSTLILPLIEFEEILEFICDDEYDKALEYLENHLKNEEGYISTKAILLTLKGDKDTAFKLIKNELKKDKENIDLIMLKGAILEDLGDEKAALEVFEEGLKIDPENRYLLIKLTELHLKANGDIFKSMVLIDKTIELDDSLPLKDDNKTYQSVLDMDFIK